MPPLNYPSRDSIEQLRAGFGASWRSTAIAALATATEWTPPSDLAAPGVQKYIWVLAWQVRTNGAAAAIWTIRDGTGGTVLFEERNPTTATQMPPSPIMVPGFLLSVNNALIIKNEDSTNTLSMFFNYLAVVIS